MSEVATATATKVKKKPKAPVEVSVSGILKMLDEGKDREKIKAELGISHADMALLFKDPALKGRKPKGTTRAKKAPGFILIHDVEASTPTSTEGTVTESAEATSEVGLADAALAAAEPVAEQAVPQPAAETLDKW